MCYLRSQSPVVSKFKNVGFPPGRSRVLGQGHEALELVPAMALDINTWMSSIFDQKHGSQGLEEGRGVCHIRGGESLL